MWLDRKRLVLAGFLLVGFVGVAGAQSEGVGAVTPEVTAQRDVTLSPEQEVAEASSYLPPMEQGASMVRRQLEQARVARDVVKTLCLNDKLNQVDVAVRTARDRINVLKAAAAHSDVDRSKHEFTVIQVLRDRVQSLVAEAGQCIGEETGFIGDSTVSVTIDPTIPEDPSEYPTDDILVEPPTLSSPIQ